MLARSRSLLRFVVALAGGVALLVACAGADDQAVLAGSAASSGTATSSGTASGSSTSSSSSSSSGGSGDGSCTSETEPNDQQSKANTLDGTLCGSISPTGDVDWLTFTLPSSTRSMGLDFSGRVRLRITVQGRGTTELTPDGDNQVPFVTNTPYYVQVAAFSDSSSALPWKISIVTE